MPHIHIKIVGKTEEEKSKLAAAITKAVIEDINAEEGNVSVHITDYEASEWIEKVYNPDIAAHWNELYKEPGYDPAKLQAAKYHQP